MFKGNSGGSELLTYRWGVRSDSRSDDQSPFGNLVDGRKLLGEHNWVAKCRK
jgi:hypothetical protein